MYLAGDGDGAAGRAVTGGGDEGTPRVWDAVGS
jgi:hypothetical protein